MSTTSTDTHPRGDATWLLTKHDITVQHRVKVASKPVKLGFHLDIERQALVAGIVGRRWVWMLEREYWLGFGKNGYIVQADDVGCLEVGLELCGRGQWRIL